MAATTAILQDLDAVNTFLEGTGDLSTTQQPQPTQTRQMYIRKDVELAKYGYTPGCEGCVAAATNQRPRMHSAECRTRIEQAMKAANDESRLIELGSDKQWPVTGKVLF